MRISVNGVGQGLQTAPHCSRFAGAVDALVRKVREHYRGGEFQEAAEAAQLQPDEFVRKMALAGDRDHTRKHPSNLQRSRVDSVQLFPVGPGRLATVDAFPACLARVSAEGGER